MRKPDRSYRSDDYYIGDTTRQVMYKKTFLVSDTEKLQMETSTNDSLMVVCNDVFFVCDRCGYAKSSSSEKEEKKSRLGDFKRRMPRGHCLRGVFFLKDYYRHYVVSFT